MPCGLCRHRWPSGIRFGRAATPRRPNRGGRWRCPRLPCRLSRSTGSGRLRTGSRRGPLWQDHGLVFASAIGTPLDAANVRREFRKITEAAGLGTEWAPRDLRHTFVSLMSADGVPIEEIARLAGHNRTATTELVYRHELRPIITRGAEVMDRILNMSGDQ
ncbi:MAG: tyrosine-type recombinase/integrase [Streptosporangiaceae bacterium]